MEDKQQLKLVEHSEASYRPDFKIRTFNEKGEFIYGNGFVNVVLEFNSKKIVIYSDGRIEELS